MPAQVNRGFDPKQIPPGQFSPNRSGGGAEHLCKPLKTGVYLLPFLDIKRESAFECPLPFLVTLEIQVKNYVLSFWCFFFLEMAHPILTSFFFFFQFFL